MTLVSPQGVPRSERLLRNAYRILGLSGDASWQAMSAAAATDRETPWDLPWLGTVPRTPADRSQAINRLVEPGQRLRERLFWFHEAAAEEAVRDLDETTIRNALEGWGASSVATAHHDAALVALLAAMVLDPRVEDVELWSRTIDEWREVLGSEAYWVEVIRVEREANFEVPAPFGEIYEAREKSLGLVLELPVGIARAAVLDDDWATARRAIEALRQALPPELFDPLVGDLAERTAHLDPGPAQDPEGGGVIPLAVPRPGPRDPRPTPGTRPLEPTLKPSTTPPPPPEPDTDPDAVTGRTPGQPAAEEESPVVTVSSGAPEPGEPAPVPPPRARERGARRRERWRPPTPVAAGLAIALATGLALALEKRSGSGTTDRDPVQMRAEDPRLAALDGDLLDHDARVAEILLARHEADLELATVRSTIDDYGELAEDYRRRVAYRLEVDRDAHARVVRLHNASLDHYRALVGHRAGLEKRLNEALAQERGFLRRYNQHVE